MSPSSLDELIESLRCLPGVGPKSAQRMAYHLLQRNQKGAARLAGALSHALAVLQHCSRCNTFSEEEICQRCANPHRDASLLCVVEMPADLAMIEQTQAYGGLYYVLMGRLSPLDGVGPRELRLDKLIARATEEAARNPIGSRAPIEVIPRMRPQPDERMWGATSAHMAIEARQFDSSAAR